MSPKPQTVHLNPDAPELWRLNAVLSGVASRHETPWHEGTASLKLAVRGAATWHRGRRRFRVEPDRYVAFREGERYRLTIDSKTPVETLAIFFRPGYLEEAAESEGVTCDPGPECYRTSDGLLDSALAVRELLRRGADEWEVWERFRSLALSYLEAGAEWRRESHNLGHLRPGTRSAVLRDLYRARDLILEESGSALTLDRVSAEAAMSPHHFHNLFSTAFRVSPHQLLTKERMRRARTLLLSSDLPAGEVAIAIGYQSEAHFNRLFTRNQGESPGRFRKNRKIEQ